MDSLVWAMTELSEGYAGGWILEGARRNAEAVTVAPTEPSAIAGELGQAQKVAAVKQMLRYREYSVRRRRWLEKF